MYYKVEYKNPNNINDITYTYETRRKSELTEWLKNARYYSGSYNILSVEKISEAKKKGGKK
jgi:hypothetical protein